MPSDLDLEVLAQEVSDEAVHDWYVHERTANDIDKCRGCAVKAAALAALQRAVEAERAACVLKLSMMSCGCAAKIRARGVKEEA